MSPPGRKDEAYIQFGADWLLGATRIQFSCAGLRIGDTFVPGIAILVYRHHTMLKPLEALIYIECSSMKKYVGRLAGDRAATEEEAPTGFIIDPNDNSVRRWDKRILGKTQRFSDEEIVTTWSNETGISTLRIDRLAGSYVLQTRLKDDNRSGLDRWGKCSRTTPDKKF